MYETYSDGLCYSVFIMEFLSPIALDFRLFVPNRAFSPVVCGVIRKNRSFFDGALNTKKNGLLFKAAFIKHSFVVALCVFRDTPKS